MTASQSMTIILILAMSGFAVSTGCGGSASREAATKAGEPRSDLISGFSAPDLSTPEKTLRTFWWAIRNGEKDIALGCVDVEKTAEGRHGTDIGEFISGFSQVDTGDFEFVVGDTRVSIRSPHHNMDYDMEKTEDGRWLIVSIHP
ncbi:MAG: hypothetical protein HQ583_08925 [Candidatus Abyssubacteria bacterium]|nr:hypothetical protein [Candidatus Abyssubacteria bacterium]